MIATANSNRSLYVLAALSFVQIFFVLIVSYEVVVYYSLLVTLVLLGISANKLAKRIDAIYIALLGFAVLSFFDIFKYNLVFNQGIVYSASHYEVAIWSYVSLFIFLISYLFYRPIQKKIRLKSRRLNEKSLIYVVFPICIATQFTTIFLLDLIGYSPYLLLLSFFAKAASVLSFFCLIKFKRTIYFIFFLIFILGAYHEISRRIYITVIFMLTPVFMSYVIEKYGKIKMVYKFLLFTVFAAAFFFMNYLRADFEGGDWRDENSKLKSTYNYMIQFHAIDTYDNTAYVLKNFPEKYDFYYGETYIAILFQFIPRSLWEDKPVGFGAPLGLLRKSGDYNFTVDKWLKKTNGFSYSPGFLNEAYANFGYLGMLLLTILFGISTKHFDTKVQFFELTKNVNLLPIAAFYSSFFLLLRGDFIMATYFSILFYLFLKILIFIGSIRAST